MESVSRTYNPKEHEERLYAWWESQGFFRPETQERLGQTRPGLEPFVIAMPPPNVTGALHLGHAIMDAVEDFLIRYRRMQGYPTLWIPGTDHAGIATQSVVEKHLEESGISRSAMGRDAFVDEVWSWKEEYHGRISGQQRRMGIACDWERERFTLDPGLARAVLTSFVQLYREGLIYRGTYLVNWSPKLQTAISDLEVEYEEEEGLLYFFQYRLRDSDDYIPVATTRPETILGDTAVAVHPEDERYRHFIGQRVEVPLMGRSVPVIAEAEVDREFGTGALKVTPGHDHADYEIGRRHGLPSISIMDEHAILNEEAGAFQGLSREEGRRQVWAAMQERGLTLCTESHTVRVPRSQRSGEIVEPMLSTQWFVRMRDMAQAAAEAVRTGRIEIIPQRFESVYFHWLDNIRDWCISRQLWWGHRIPVWYGPDEAMFCAENEEEAHRMAARHYGESVALRQDPDVLDTWYSSSLWPFSTLGWPDETPDMRRFYPNTVMETGYDILFFWVARMIMMGLKFTGEIPFHTIYLHGLVRDADGRKMSKSLNNVIDPLDLIQEFGADPLRLSLLTGITPGNDMKLNRQRIESNRNFSNKMWNALRFLLPHLQRTTLSLRTDDDPFATVYALPDQDELSLPDRWILSRLSHAVSETTRLIESWQFGEAGSRLYDFLWHEMCDWYLEAAKISLNGEDEPARRRTTMVLAHTLETGVRLLHPFMPFLTEAIWQHLPGLTAPIRTLMLARWPEPAGSAEGAERDFGLLQRIVRTVRNARSEHRIDPGLRLTARIETRDQGALLEANRAILCALARLDPERLTISSEVDAADDSLVLAVERLKIHLPWSGFVDVEAELTRLRKELAKISAHAERARNLLANEQFLAKAPEAVINRERAGYARLQNEVAQVQSRMEQLESRT